MDNILISLWAFTAFIFILIIILFMMEVSTLIIGSLLIFIGIFILTGFPYLVRWIFDKFDSMEEEK